MSFFSSTLLHWAINAATDAGKKAALQTTQDLASQLLAHLHQEAPDVAAAAEKQIQAGILMGVAGIQSRLKS